MLGSLAGFSLLSFCRSPQQSAHRARVEFVAVTASVVRPRQQAHHPATAWAWSSGAEQMMWCSLLRPAHKLMPHPRCMQTLSSIPGHFTHVSQSMVPVSLDKMEICLILALVQSSAVVMIHTSAPTRPACYFGDTPSCCDVGVTGHVLESGCGETGLF